jgi:LysR family nitrogen assimilation transcriptional regulator
MDSRQLRYFDAIYRHGSLSSAAEHLRVAASALSHHLANLEADLGAALFLRKPRGMQPTAAGERLHEHARAILRAMSQAEKDLRASGDEVAGEVSIGMAYSAVKAIGVDLMRRVLADYPRLRLSLTESLSGSTLVHLISSEVELALVYNPPSEPRLKTIPVLEERMICVGRCEIIGETDAPITFDALLELPIILLRRGVSARALTDDSSLLTRLESRALMQMNSVYAIGGALEAGLGCAIGTRLFMQEQLQSGALHMRPIIAPELARTLFLCEMSDRPATFALETVRSLILDLVGKAVAEGRWDATSLIGQKARS